MWYTDIGQQMEKEREMPGNGGLDRDRPRVGRPPLLTVDRVVEAAIEIVDAGGLDGLSMPKLAARLDVGTMTLYGYVTDKQQLLDLMAARIFRDLEVGEREAPDLVLGDFFRAFRRAALSHPALAQLLAGGRITIPAVFDTLEAVLEPMINRGHSAHDAVRTFYAALTYTLGFVLWEIPRTQLQAASDYEAQWGELIAGLDPRQYPIVTGSAAVDLASTSSDEQFEWGLRRILGAIPDDGSALDSGPTEGHQSDG